FFTTPPALSAIYTLSLHDALPISVADCRVHPDPADGRGGGAAVPRIRDHALGGDPGVAAGVTHHDADDVCARDRGTRRSPQARRSEEHTSELQSRGHLVCRLLLEK